MALRPWRFQADVSIGELNPMVTLFVGPERYVMDDQGEPTAEMIVEQNITDPVVIPFSELAATLAAGTITRKSKP